MQFNLSKNLSDKCSQKVIDHAKESATNALNHFKRIIQETAEATGHLIGYKVADRITKDKKTLQQNISETVINEPGTPKERYTSPEKIQKIIYDLRFK